MKRKTRLLAFLIAGLLLLTTACQTVPDQPSQPPEGEGQQTEDPSQEPQQPAYTSLDDFQLFDENNQLIRTGRDAVGSQGVVSTSKYEASKIGVQIIEDGGNAVDAAVAVAFALGFVEPNASGLGGGGFMLIHVAETGEDIFIDFRERAPMAATPDLWELDEDGKVTGNEKITGGKSNAVPGEVAGMMYILENYGTMSREEVMRPAVELANQGITVTPFLSTAMKDKYDLMQQFPEFGQLFLKEDGLPYEPGEIFRNPEYAKTLELIIENGADGFYKGEVAEAIVATNNKYSGVMTLEDLANYQINVLQPIRGTYRGYEIVSAPPPSSGGTIVIEILNILENFDLPSMEAGSAEELHIIAEAFKLAYADRAAYMGDPNYVDVPLEGLTSKEYAKVLTDKIDLEKAQEQVIEDDPFAHQGMNTTHFSIADKDGNIVAVTKTINYYFGSGVAVGGYGFMLNDEMDDFVTGYGHANSVEGGKTPLSSMTPTIVLKDGQPFMVLGTPGGTTIISTVVQVISKVIDHGYSIQDAVDAPRIRGSAVTNELPHEARMPADVVQQMKELGHDMIEGDEWAYGCVQAVLFGEDGLLYGAADPRQDSKALGF